MPAELLQITQSSMTQWEWKRLETTRLERGQMKGEASCVPLQVSGDCVPVLPLFGGQVCLGSACCHWPHSTPKAA